VPINPSFSRNYKPPAFSLWSLTLIQFLSGLLVDASKDKGESLSLMLTGGRTTCKLYDYLASQGEFVTGKYSYYFGDERCVAPDHIDSNYGLARSTLFQGTEPHNVERIKGESSNPEDEAIRYSAILPYSIDILLLSVGEDGHIASLFPNSKALSQEQKVVYVTDAPKVPSNRITITPNVIHSAKQVIVMAAGNEKGKILARALIKPYDYNELPVRLTIGLTWILDHDASTAFKQYAPNEYHKTRIIYA
jgi:6-phosphogluconolactonase